MVSSLSLRLAPVLCLFVACLAHAERPDLPLANVYEGDADLSAYLVSEKYDGFRAFWTGQRFLSRRGNPYHAPDWFTEPLPDRPMDGELWMGRGRFAELSGAVRKDEPVDREWRSIRFMVFDLPVRDMPFRDRLMTLKSLVRAADTPHLKLVKQQPVGDREALAARLDQVVDAGGEGLMLKRADSLYHAGRSDDLLKVKRHRDAEAEVIRSLPGEGQFEGMMGSLLVELENGRRMRIGTGFSHAERENPPEPGAVITYRYYGRTSTGLPRFASFMRVRRPAE
ncbi:DNA ligase [Tamilnaduibacter salinus]|uniref:DNA ligase n=1 Tax=Tamilnaduibacter salinus TaxID=1484056 RepID=A0A2A2I327_9GAMM|nr:DNA ligase [Tamilnaduibacter salinus]PAV25500.1 DNA ligase [Tamilnaduibacter salinus]